MAGIHAVLGATGGVGAALTAELVRRGHTVRAVSRGGRTAVPGAEPVAADLADAAALAAVLDGVDVVHHAAQPAYTRWPEEFPAMTRRVVDATAAAGARLVVVDNLYMYGPVPGGYGPGTPHGPLVEGTPEQATGRKGAVRAAMSRDLLRAHDHGRLSVTIGRLADYHGPGGLTSSVGERLFDGALARRPAQWLGGLDHPHSFTYLPDAARALATLADQPGAAAGRVWHLPVAPPVTPRQFIGLVHEAAGAPDRVRVVPAWAVAAAGRFVPLARELAELSYQVDRPFVVDDSRYRESFGDVEPTPHREAVAATLAWFADRAGAVEPVSATPA